MRRRKSGVYSAHVVVVYGDHVQSCVAVRVLPVDVDVLGTQQTHTLLLAEARREAQRILAPVRVPARVPTSYVC